MRSALALAAIATITNGAYNTPFDNTPGLDGTNLGICQGDCDTNANCKTGLACFHRENSTANAPIQGCSGTSKASWDYCIRDPRVFPSVVLVDIDISGTNLA